MPGEVEVAAEQNTLIGPNDHFRKECKNAKRPRPLSLPSLTISPSFLPLFYLVVVALAPKMQPKPRWVPFHRSFRTYGQRTMEQTVREKLLQESPQIKQLANFLLSSLRGRKGIMYSLIPSPSCLSTDPLYVVGSLSNLLRTEKHVKKVLSLGWLSTRESDRSIRTRAQVTGKKCIAYSHLTSLSLSISISSSLSPPPILYLLLLFSLLPLLSPPPPSFSLSILTFPLIPLFLFSLSSLFLLLSLPSPSLSLFFFSLLLPSFHFLPLLISLLRTEHFCPCPLPLHPPQVILLKGMSTSILSVRRKEHYYSTL